MDDDADDDYHPPLNGDEDRRRRPAAACRGAAAAAGEMAEVGSDNDDDGRGTWAVAQSAAAGDSPVSKPAAALSTRASAFSIAALIRDQSSAVQADTDRRLAAAAAPSVYATAAVDRWPRVERARYGGESGGEIVGATSEAEYWTGFTSTAQRRTFITHLYCTIIIIIIKGIYVAQVRKGHRCAMSAEMAVWLRNCLCLYSYLHN